MVKEKFTSLAGYGIKSMRRLFKNEMLNHQSKCNLDEKILISEITRHLDAEIWNMLVNGTLGNEDSTFHSGA